MPRRVLHLGPYQPVLEGALLQRVLVDEPRFEKFLTDVFDHERVPEGEPTGEPGAVGWVRMRARAARPSASDVPCNLPARRARKSCRGTIRPGYREAVPPA